MITATAAKRSECERKGTYRAHEKNASKATSTSTPASAQRSGGETRGVRRTGERTRLPCPHEEGDRANRPDRHRSEQLGPPATRQQPGDQHGRGQRSHEQRGERRQRTPLWPAAMVSARRGTTISASGRISAKPVR